MRPSVEGLTQVPLSDLRKALRAVHRGDLECPISPENLARVGLQHQQEPLMAQLRGCQTRGVRAVLVSVIAERMAR